MYAAIVEDGDLSQTECYMLEEYTFGKNPAAVNLAKILNEKKDSLPFDFIRRLQSINSSYGRGLRILFSKIPSTEKAVRNLSLHLWRDRYLDVINALLNKHNIDEIIKTHVRNLFITRYKETVRGIYVIRR